MRFRLDSLVARYGFTPAARFPLGGRLDEAGSLNDHNQGLLTSRYVQSLGTIYSGNVVSASMNDWSSPCSDG